MPTSPEDEETITARWERDKPTITVLCMAYQHVQFIETAMWGFLNQRSSYPFEIVVRDDASTDGTQQIIEQYATQYPNLVRPYFEPHNVGRGKANEVYGRLFEYARGRYFATCEGDDYWIDPEKLEMQASFLDSHDEYDAVSGWAVPMEDGTVIGPPRGGHSTRTVMFRRGAWHEWPPRAEVYFGDTFQATLLGYENKLLTLPRLMAVWRKHGSGVFGQYVLTDDRYLHYQRAKTRYWIAAHLENHGHRSRAEREYARSLSHLATASGVSKRRLVFALAAEPVRRILGRVKRGLVRLVRK